MGRSGRGDIDYLFVDGGCLHSVLENASTIYFGGSTVDLNYHALGQGYDKIFYYDSLPAQKNGEPDPDYQVRKEAKHAFFNQLRRMHRYHVFEGTARYRQRRGQEQKQVDIMIAVDMLTYSFRRNMTRATLLAGDLDFKPLVDALVQDGMHVTLLYPPGETNPELIYAADDKIPFSIQYLHQRTTSKFQSSHHLPTTNGYVGKQTANVTFVEKWQDPLFEVELYQGPSEYLIVVPQKDYDGTYIHVSHPDSAALKRYVREMYTGEDAVWGRT